MCAVPPDRASGLINELYYVGIANAFFATNAQGLDQIVQYIEQSQPFSVTAEYSIVISGTVHRGSSTLNFFAPPTSLRIGRGDGFRPIILFAPPGTYTLERATDVVRGPGQSVATITKGKENGN